MTDYDDEEHYFDDEGDNMVEEIKTTGEGVTVHIGQQALAGIEAACIVGIRRELSKKLDDILEEMVRETATEHLQAVVGKITEDAVMAYLTKARPRTNAWGEPVSGTPMTIADQIPEKVEKYLTETVDSEGRKDNSYGGRMPRIDWIMRKIVIPNLDVATKEAAKSVSDKAKQVVSAHVGRFVAEQMVPQIEVSKTGN